MGTPLPIKNVRLAKDPLRTVAKGSLVAAISMEKKKLAAKEQGASVTPGGQPKAEGPTTQKLRASVASRRPNGPVNTGTRAHSRRSDEVHSSWLQPIAARSDRCRPCSAELASSARQPGHGDQRGPVQHAPDRGGLGGAAHQAIRV